MDIIILIILIVLVIALFVVSYAKRKKYNTELAQMREELRVGDKVMTDAGIVGEVVESFDDENYKYFVLKTGRESNVGFITVHANAIYYVFGKENITKSTDNTNLESSHQATTETIIESESTKTNNDEKEIVDVSSEKKQTKSTKKTNKKQ